MQYIFCGGFAWKDDQIIKGYKLMQFKVPSFFIWSCQPLGLSYFSQ